MRCLTYLSIGAAITYLAFLFYNMYHLFHPEGAGPNDDGYSNSVKDGEPVDVYAFLTTGRRACEHFIESSANETTPFNKTTCLLVWKSTNIRYGYYNETMAKTVSLDNYVLDGVRKTKNLMLHVYMTRSSFAPHPKLGKYDPNEVSVTYGIMSRTLVPRKMAVNLLGLEADIEESPEENDNLADRVPELHIGVEANVGLVYDATIYVQGKFPGDIVRAFRLLQHSQKLYKPIVYFNGFWMGESKFLPLRDINESRIDIVLETMSLGKYRLTNQMDVGTSMMKDSYGLTDKDMDAVRDLITRNSPTFLMLTFFVSIVHLLFDFLAAKNEVGYWRKRKSNQGISSRAVIFNAIGQIIVFLYLMDNDTSMLIVVPSGLQSVIDMWKVKKVMKLSIEYDSSRMIPFRARYGDILKGETETEAADYEATQWMMWLLYPLMIGYAIYSLIYDEHHGWYSWLLNTVTGYFYAFGFIAMTPQLFINHRLKSVAHLPWRALCYKAFNTFIDDVFAFLIHMPTMHRIACFRDDVIFFCFIYQLYLYPVDPTRTNEYGMSLKDEAEMLVAEKETTIEEDDAQKKKGDDKDEPNVTSEVIEASNSSTRHQSIRRRVQK
eukprot:CFRG4838T1